VRIYIESVFGLVELVGQFEGVYWECVLFGGTGRAM